MNRATAGTTRPYSVCTASSNMLFVGLASDPATRELVGYSQDLKALAKHAYLRFLHRREAGNGPINGWHASR